MSALVPRQGWVFAASLLAGLLALYFAGFLSIHAMRGVQSWQLIFLPVVSLGVAHQLFRTQVRPWRRAAVCLGGQLVLLVLACGLAGLCYAELASLTIALKPASVRRGRRADTRRAIAAARAAHLAP